MNISFAGLKVITARNSSKAIAAFITLVAALVIFGWIFDSLFLKSLSLRGNP